MTSTRNETAYREAMNLGHSAAWDQDWDAAAKHYFRAVEASPDSFQALSSVGLALFNMQTYDQALKFYMRAAQVSPNDPLPIEKVAEIYERTGKIEDAVKRSMQAAELYLNLRDPDKAIQNWTRVTSLKPEHLPAHSRLAMVHEKMGNKNRSITEYLAVASLLQQKVKLKEALQTVQHAVKIDPQSSEATEALKALESNRTLPLPLRQPGGTDALRMAAVREMEKLPAGPNGAAEEGPDPITEARQKALTVLAGLLFETGDEKETANGHLGGGLGSGVSGSLAASSSQDRSKMTKHLGQAVDLQTHGERDQAIEQLKRAIDAGLEHPAAHFNIGLLMNMAGREKNAQRHLQLAISHLDFGLAARLLIGEYQRKLGNLNEAAEEYLEGLKIADTSLVAEESADELRQLYEPLIEAHAQEEDEGKLEKLCDNVEDLLLRPNWRRHLMDAREQLPGASGSLTPMPLAEMISQANSGEVVEALARINNLAREGYLRTAMEEAFTVLDLAPTYLPLHISMGDLLMRQDRLQEAIDKFTMVANAYSARGEANRSTDLFRRIVEVSPMDLAARTRLIDQLVSRGQVDDALTEYLNLADVYYRLAELDMARTTYQTSLRMAQESRISDQWQVQIMHHMADIDVQRLDWRQALVVYEQVRTLAPDDELARTNLIDLNVRLGNDGKALAELDNFSSYLVSNAREAHAVAYMAKLVGENPNYVFARGRLAERYQQSGQVDKAVEQWDQVGEMLLEKITVTSKGIMNLVPVWSAR